VLEFSNNGMAQIPAHGQRIRDHAEPGSKTYDHSIALRELAPRRGTVGTPTDDACSASVFPFRTCTYRFPSANA